MAAARRMYWWYAAAASAPTNGPTQKIHCINPTKGLLKFKFINSKSLPATTYMVVPGFFTVVDHGGAEASSRVDSGAGDGNGG